MKKRFILFPIILLSSLIGINCQKNNSSFSANEQSRLITPDIIEIANNYDYNFDPKAVYIERQDSYDYSNEELTQLQVGEIRENHNLVYVFEGWYDEGYASVPPFRFTGRIYLWDDGLYAGLINDIIVKGYWYNSCENGDDSLVLISNQENYEQNIATIYNGDCFKYQMSYYVPFSWGHRNMLMNGYYYYPDVAISFSCYLYEEHIFKVGDYFNVYGEFDVLRILKNLNYLSLLYDERDIVVWEVPDGMLDADDRIISSGEYIITAHYKNFSNSLIVKVK